MTDIIKSLSIVACITIGGFCLASAYYIVGALSFMALFCAFIGEGVGRDRDIDELASFCFGLFLMIPGVIIVSLFKKVKN